MTMLTEFATWIMSFIFRESVSSRPYKSWSLPTLHTLRFRSPRRSRK